MISINIRQRMLAGFVPLLVAMVAMMTGTFLQVIRWGVLSVRLGEFMELYETAYHSAVNFASLCFGDIVMRKQWNCSVRWKPSTACLSIA